MGDDSQGIVHLLLPSFDVGVSLNGHIEEFRLGERVYFDIVEDEDINAFDFTQIWTYISKHIHEYLLDIIEHTGPIDADNVRLVSLKVSVLSSPESVHEVVDCEGCREAYEHEVEGCSFEEDEDD